MSRSRFPTAPPGSRIGLLGGSFDPAHSGHLHISLEALKRLQLDRVWWLVAPQNPLKRSSPTKPLEQRAKAARRVAQHSTIVVTDIERSLASRYSIDTVNRLIARWPNVHFVWLMGADIFPQMPLWKCWTDFMEIIPIAVFNRPGYGLKALSCLPAKRYSAFRWDMSDAVGITTARPPAWSFMHIPLHEKSSTNLRAEAMT